MAVPSMTMTCKEVSIGRQDARQGLARQRPSRRQRPRPDARISGGEVQIRHSKPLKVRARGAWKYGAVIEGRITRRWHVRYALLTSETRHVPLAVLSNMLYRLRKSSR
jgi:hypothetical protein